MNLYEFYLYLVNRFDSGDRIYLPDVCKKHGFTFEHVDSINRLPCIVITVENGYQKTYFVKTNRDFLFDSEDVRTVIY